MGELGFRDGLMEQIRLRESRFHESAFLFVLASLEFLQSRMPERRHVDGRELAHASGLPQVASFVRRDHVQPRGQAEPHPAHEWIREPDAGQIDVRIFSQKRPHLILRRQELTDGVGEGGGAARLDDVRRLAAKAQARPPRRQLPSCWSFSRSPGFALIVAAFFSAKSFQPAS